MRDRTRGFSVPSDRSPPCAEGGEVASCRHTQLVRSLAWLIRSALRRCGSLLSHRESHNLGVRSGPTERISDCQIATSDPLWLTGLGILLALACAFWGSAVLP